MRKGLAAGVPVMAFVVVRTGVIDVKAAEMGEARERRKDRANKGAF